MPYSKEEWRGIMQSIVESSLERDYDEHPYDEHGEREPLSIYWSPSTLSRPIWPPGHWRERYETVVFEPDSETGLIGVWGASETAEFTSDELMSLLNAVGYSWAAKLMAFAKGSDL